jgi:hypothetical protein
MTFSLELLIAHGQDFIHNEDARLLHGRHSKPQQGYHPGRLGSQEGIDESANVGKIKNLPAA